MAQRIWEKTQAIYQKYKKAWKGPKIPIFIFPMDHTNIGLMKEGKGKSGVSFKDKLFLFLTPMDDEKKLEALFVHEYHHVCRMNGQKKRVEDYTLLDSIILEGLAEHAVARHCGEAYTGEWSKRFTKKELGGYWKRYFSGNLSMRRENPLHDRLLFGLGGRPKLLGYAMGYEIITQYQQQENFSEKASFQMPSEQFIKDLKF
ncbi:DUF2268 domain-containing protein [Bacillus sp. REN3]|uniref:DUF2268 domain-containing protein n=1 Tax=Bacillus sp. REN3 TaxID=2802440 RepID=UPI001AEE9EF9|nr:DUF2268 domain-containing protein [Bacillus sp. REN3]